MTPLRSFVLTFAAVAAATIVAALTWTNIIGEAWLAVLGNLAAVGFIAYSALAIIGQFSAVALISGRDERWFALAFAFLFIGIGIASLNSAWPVPAALALGAGTMLLLFTVDRAVRARRGDPV